MSSVKSTYSDALDKETTQVDLQSNKDQTVNSIVEKQSSDLSSLAKTDPAVDPQVNQDSKKNLPEQTILDLIVVIILCISTSFSGFIFGWDVGTIGGISNMQGFKNRFGYNYLNLGELGFSPIIIGLIIAVFNAGCGVGGLTIPKFTEKYGRKTGVVVSVIIYIVGSLIQITSRFSSKWPQFLVGRIITGLAVGSTSVLTPMFISESSPLKIRGAMVVLYQLMITAGIAFGNITNYSCNKYYSNTDKEWLIPVGLQFLWAILIVVGIYFMPESPVFYVNHKDDVDSAKQSLAKLNNVSIDSPTVEFEVNKIIDDRDLIQQECGDSLKWNEFLTGKPRLLLRLFIGIGVMFFQQFSGANYFFYYGTSLFKSVGIDDSYITSIILAIVNFISTFISIYIVEKFGRKACLFWGSIGMFICMIIYTCLGSFKLTTNDHVTGGFMIAFTCVYIFFFATTWGPVSFVLISELYPVRVRSISMSIATSINWFANFLISLFTPFITHAIGYKLGFIFTGCLLVSAIFVYFLVPETKGLRIEEVDALYKKEVSNDDNA